MKVIPHLLGILFVSMMLNIRKEECTKEPQKQQASNDDQINRTLDELRAQGALQITKTMFYITMSENEGERRICTNQEDEVGPEDTTVYQQKFGDRFVLVNAQILKGKGYIYYFTGNKERKSAPITVDGIKWFGVDGRGYIFGTKVDVK